MKKVQRIRSKVDEEEEEEAYNKLVIVSFCICDRSYKIKCDENAEEEEAIVLTVNAIAVSSHCSSL